MGKKLLILLQAFLIALLGSVAIAIVLICMWVGPWVGCVQTTMWLVPLALCFNLLGFGSAMYLFNVTLKTIFKLIK